MLAVENCWDDARIYDYPQIVDDLFKYLKLKTLPIGLKRYKDLESLQKVEKIRIADDNTVLNTDQFIGKCRWQGYTLGFMAKNLTGSQCSAVVGLTPRDNEFLGGNLFNGVWYGSLEDSAEHQQAMSCAPYGEYQAVGLSPLSSGRLGNPDICLIYGTPGQMITFINGLQWANYKKYSFTCVGESSCADSWGNALKTGEPSLSIPCYAERKFGGVQDDELLMAIPPSFLPATIEGLKALSKNGLRYPIPNSGLDTSPLATMAKSYG